MSESSLSYLYAGNKGNRVIVRSREGWKDKQRTYTKDRVERGDIEKNT